MMVVSTVLFATFVALLLSENEIENYLIDIFLSFFNAKRLISREIFTMKLITIK